MPSPITGVSVAVFCKQRVLLVKRGKEPYRGYWSLPGGGQLHGETLEDAARRELAEETALTAGSLAFVRIHEPIRRDASGRVVAHFVLAVFGCRDFTGTASAGDDAAEVAWCALGAIGDRRLTPGTAQVVAEAFAAVHPATARA